MGGPVGLFVFLQLLLYLLVSLFADFFILVFFGGFKTTHTEKLGSGNGDRDS